MAGSAVLVIVADARHAAAAAGFLEPEGISVKMLVRRHPLAPAEVMANRATRMVLLDWSLLTPDGRHLGAALRAVHPQLWLVALVAAGVLRPEPTDWDRVVSVPLVRDVLVRAVQDGAAQTP